MLPVQLKTAPKSSIDPLFQKMSKAVVVGEVEALVAAVHSSLLNTDRCHGVMIKYTYISCIDLNNNGAHPVCLGQGAAGPRCGGGGTGSLAQNATRFYSPTTFYFQLATCSIFNRLLLYISYDTCRWGPTSHVALDMHGLDQV